jgi:uncharacterized protein (AIM24 family)
MLFDNPNVEQIASQQNADGSFKVEILQLNKLEGSRSLLTAQALYYANTSGPHLKFVRIVLNRSAATLESGALSFMKGHLEITSNTGGLGGLAKGIATKMLTNETVIRPRYQGNGEIILEPSFGHFLIVPLEANQTLITDKGMYYCSEGTVEVGIATQKNFSAGQWGGEGWFQTKVTGPGLVVLSSPVPRSEIITYDLSNEKLQVDGNFALMRSEGINFSVQKSTKSLFGSAVSGEGLLQTFEGTGRVWLAPTQSIYDNLHAWERLRITGPQAS